MLVNQIAIMLGVFMLSFFSEASDSGCPRRIRCAGGSHSNVAGNFDFYALALSSAPKFCEEHPSNSSPECNPDNQYGLVLHGLWPTNDDQTWPQACDTKTPVSNDELVSILDVVA